MKKLKDRINQDYLRICWYALATILVAFILITAIHNSQIVGRIWKVFTAVITPVVYGAIICYLIRPISRRFEKLFTRGKPTDGNASSKLTVTLSVIASILVVALGLSLIIFLIILVVYRNAKAMSLDQIKTFIASIGMDFSQLAEALTEKISDMGLPIGDIGSKVTVAIEGVKNFFSTALFSIIFSIYFLFDGDRIYGYWRRVLGIIVGDQAKDRMAIISKDLHKVFSGYIRGQFIDALIVGTLAGTTLSIARVPYGFVVGILMGLGNLIPYFGALVGYISLIIVCLLNWNIQKLIVGVICLVVIMFIDSNVINPRLLGNQIEVHPLLVVAALLGGGAIGGLAGMLIAVPIAAFIKIQFERYLTARVADSGEIPAPDQDQITKEDPD